MTFARTKPLQRTGKLRPVSKKRAAHYASDEGKAGLAHMARVRSLPCVICHEWDMVQQSPTAAHHCIHGRYSARKAPDIMTIPLCEGHHQGLLDTTKIALHQHPSKWKRLYGEDTGWLSWVETRLGKDDKNVD